MLEILKYIFSDICIFLGTVILISLIGQIFVRSIKAITKIVYANKSQKKFDPTNQPLNS